MRIRRDQLTQEYLKQILHYDPATGFFTWKVSRGYQAKKGNRAGYDTHSGYLAIGINRVRYYAHRLAWLYVHGTFPKAHLDHINGVTCDNRICNLRVASAAENISNGKHRVNNTSGVKGLRFLPRSGKWQGQVRKNYRNYHTKSFSTREEAVEALRVLRVELHGRFARH